MAPSSAAARACHAVALVLLLLSGCASGRQGLGPDLAAAAGWHWGVLPAGDYDLASASRPGMAQDGIATVYIEGDGLAYLSFHQPAQDPTPTDPLALRLALAHPAEGAVAWLARPCQYTMPEHGRGCRRASWTTHRYAADTVAALDAALGQLKARLGADRLVLVGYSGGGALAALLAARRQDVVALVTVAANLDLHGWLASHGLPPMPFAQDPAQLAAPALGRLRQWHFSGAEDRVTGAVALRGFARRLPPGSPAWFEDVPGFDHACCWAREWPRLWLRTLRR